MAITLRGSASTPADNAAQPGPGPISVTPPGSMQLGDLVLAMIKTRTAGVEETLGFSNTGGQNWSTLLWNSTTNLSWALVACRFNGTWTGGNPSFVDGQGQTTAMTVKMDVFAPSSTSKVMDIDWSPVPGTFAAGSSPFTKTITGITTRNNGAAAIAYWMSVDDNTWGSLTAGWSNAGGSQIRNTTGSQTSISVAYQVFATAQATGNVSQNQATNGGDAGGTCILSIYERDPDFQSVPPVDVFWTGENSTEGTTMTATIMNNGTTLAAANGTFSILGAGNDNMTVETNAQYGLGARSVTVSAVSMSDSAGTRGMELDHGNQGGTSRYFAWEKSSAVAKASFGCWFMTTLPYGQFDSFSLMGLQDIGFGGGCFLNIANYEGSLHRVWHENTAGTIKLLGRITQNQRVWVSGYYDQATNIGRLALFDTSFNQIGFQTAHELGTSPPNWQQFVIGSFGGNFPGTAPYTGTISRFDDAIIDFTNAVFPLGPATAASDTLFGQVLT